VALVVVRHGAGAAFLQGKPGLRAVEGLNLGLFIDAEDDGPVGRIQIEAHDVGEFLQELGVTG
jgi:hypothetical protein